MNHETWNLNFYVINFCPPEALLWLMNTNIFHNAQPLFPNEEFFFRWGAKSRFTQNATLWIIQENWNRKDFCFLFWVKNARWWIKDDELLCSRWYSILIDVYQRFQQKELETKKCYSFLSSFVNYVTLKICCFNPLLPPPCHKLSRILKIERDVIFEGALLWFFCIEFNIDQFWVFGGNNGKRNFWWLESSWEFPSRFFMITDNRWNFRPHANSHQLLIQLTFNFSFGES